MKTWWRSRRSASSPLRLVGAAAMAGLAAAAAAVSVSVFDEPNARSTSSASGSELAVDGSTAATAAILADPVQTDARPIRAEPVDALGRPVLRVGDGSLPSAPATSTTVPSESSDTSAKIEPTTTASSSGPATDSVPVTDSGPVDDSGPVTDSGPVATSPADAGPAPIERADVDGRFVTLAPGSPLPSGAECARRVRPTPENVPENQTRNQTRGGPVSGTYLSDNPSIAANGYESRIDGGFVGSTDEIIQWAACKWGFDEDLLRAQVYAESTWYAGKLGDCGESTVPETRGCSSVGLIQVRSAERSGTHHPGVYPQAWRSSALNLDYALAVKRLCFEGLETWLGQAGDYQAGDEWNCLGRWFSGSWADAGSRDYQATVRDILARRPWETWVGCRDWRTNNHCAN